MNRWLRVPSAGAVALVAIAAGAIDRADAAASCLMSPLQTAIALPQAGFVDARGGPPARGVVISTSTSGFRTLRALGNGGLPWLGDRDNDGRAELVIWSDFFLNDKQVQSESGLAGWVYRVAPAGDRLTLDWTLSRALAREVAAAYRAPLADTTATAGATREMRAGAADALAAFADKRCDVAEEQPR